MNYTWWAAIALFAVVLLVLKALKTAPHRYPYQQREFLFTPAEWRFLETLRRAVPEGVDIFGKVRVADVLKPEPGLDRGTWQRAFNRTAGKHFDFVLCDRGGGRVVCVIELNDRSHQQRARQDRDAFITGACKHAGLPLLMVPAARHYDPAALRGEIEHCVATGSTAPTPADVAMGESPFPEPGLDCPECGSPLVERTARRGPNAGRCFLSCSRFPQCRYSRSL